MGKRRFPAVENRNTSERVLGFDCSSVCCGFAVFEGFKLKTYGRFHQEGKEHGERLHHFRLWLLSMFQEVKPDQVVFEAPYAGRRRYAFGVLMMYTAVIIQTYFEWTGQELPADNRVMAGAVKKILRAKHGATHETRKRLMVLAMNEAYGLNLKFKSKDQAKRISEDDISDAIALVRAWLIRRRGLEV